MPTGTLMTRSSPPAPVRFEPDAALAARRAEMLGVAKVDQRVEAGDRLEDDVAALAAIAAVGAAIFDVLLAPEADGAGAAGARADEDLGLVEKMHGAPLAKLARAYAPAVAAVSAAAAASSMASSASSASSRALSRGRPSARAIGAAEQRIAERHQHQLQRLLLDRLLAVACALGQFVDQIVDRVRIGSSASSLPDQDHPARQRAGAALAERVEGQVDDLARILARRRARAAPPRRSCR